VEESENNPLQIYTNKCFSTSYYIFSALIPMPQPENTS
jgi:hypothetical protein